MRHARLSSPFPAFALLVLGASACFDADSMPDRDVRATPAAPVSGAIAYLTISDASPLSGDTVTVTARVRRGRDVGVLASFAAELTFDPTGLEYAGEAAVGAGAHALRQSGAAVRVAGAAATGFTDDRLFAIRFVVHARPALATLSLRLNEVSGTDFRSVQRDVSARSGAYREPWPEER